MRLRRPRATIAKKVGLAAVAGLALAGCGEIKNTINPKPGTTDQVSVALPAQTNAFEIGIYEAAALGYFKQADMNVHVVTPGAGQDAVTMVHDGRVLLGVASEVDVLLHRNENQPVVGVAALVNGPLTAITIPVPKGGQSGGVGVTTSTTTTGTTVTRTTSTPPRHHRRHRKHRKTTARTTTTPTTTTPAVPTTTTVAEPDATLWPAQLQQLLSQPGAPTFDGLVVVARKGSIVSHAPLIRRFVQAVARGYRAARAHPTQAITNLIDAVPALAPQRPLERATLTAAMPYFFTSGKVWGWQQPTRWNAFGTWLTQNHLLSNPNAIGDASTNELLQGQGV